MTNVNEIEVEQSNGAIEVYIVIDSDNGSTSMLKSTYDEQQAAHNGKQL